MGMVSWLTTLSGEREDVPRRFEARAELTLSRDDALPLREVPLRPDPLTPFARAYAQLRDDLHESAEVVIDLMPVTQAQRRQRRRDVLAAERPTSTKSGSNWTGELMAGLNGQAASRRSPRPVNRRQDVGPLQQLDDRADVRRRSSKLLSVEPMFALQVLIRTSSEVKGRPEAHLHALIACFEQWSGDNSFRVAGRNLLGLAHLGSDVAWRRRGFDRRMNTGLFKPEREVHVSAGELAGLLKPPTTHCKAQNVVRSGGVIPPPPQGLPAFAFQPDVLPLGKVRTHDGERAVGVYVKDTYFAYFGGRSRYGKTETAINQFIHLARSGHGCFFLDPHEDALNRIRPYLTDVADRVVELNLAPRGGAHRQAGWNLFSMEGRDREHIEGRVSAVVDSFASALRWGEINNRALTLTTMASQALLELAVALPPELAPTIFQINTLLANEDWREAVIPVLSAPNREFWRTRFAKLQPEAITPVTNLIDRLRSSVSVSALLGSSRSTYDVRRAMDQGQIVLACPAGTGDKDRLVANFLVYDLLQAALSRKDLGPDKRRPFYLVLDEVQTFDGASRGNLAALLEQSAKYGVRALLCNQNPERLTPSTFDAVTTNRSHLSATVLNARAARLIAKEWGDMVAPETIGRLERFTYLTSVTLKGQVTPPFLVRGLEVCETWADHCGDAEAIEAMNDTIDRNLRRRPVADTVADLDTLDERILAHLRGGRQGVDKRSHPTAAAHGRGRHQRVRRN
jgi:hypothetical protein